MIHIYATPGPDKLALYAASDIVFPDAEHRQWATKNGSSAPTLYDSFMMDNEFTPFVLNEANQIEYRPDFITEVSKGTKQASDSVALKLDGYNWKHLAKSCHIGAHNRSSEPITVWLTVSGE